MTQSLVEYSIQSGVAEVALNRPDRRNALTRDFLRQLRAAVDAVAGDRTARLLLLIARGTAFCAGMDLDEMQARAMQPNSAAEWDRDTEAYHDLLVSILELDVPSVAVVQGAAMAGGVGIALSCDMVIASTEAKFALPEPKRGITAAVVAPLLVRRIGIGPATTMLLSGATLSATAAHRVGLCDQCVQPNVLASTCKELSASILTGAPGALATTKRLIRSFDGDRLASQMREAMRVSSEARRTAEAREGLAAFLERRSPNWVADSG